MTGDETFLMESALYTELELSCLQELGNILSGSYLFLSDFTRLNIYPSVPSLKHRYGREQRSDVGYWNYLM